MNGLGTHILLDLYGCDPGRLNDLEFLRQMSLEGVRRSGATVMGEHFKQFKPQGVSGIIIIAESHLSLHSWPEFSYIAMDYFTCGDRIDIDTAISYFEEKLSPQKIVSSKHARGEDLGGNVWGASQSGPIQEHSQWYTEYHWEEEDPRRLLLGYKYAMDRQLLHTRSQFQEILVLENPVYGRMLFLDGFVMTTEKDEFAYHEMLSHVPLLLHGSPADVLIIGGGDGGLLREVLKHPMVQRVDMVEIDPQVVEASRSHLPAIGCAFDDLRARLHFEDGAEYVKTSRRHYDVILVDSTDPTGPGKVLFGRDFFGNCRKALKKGGVFAAQALSAWVQEREQIAMFTELKRTWRTVVPYVATIPTYPGGLWTFAIGADFAVDPFAFDQQRAKDISKSCRYYNTDVHQGSFYLPNFLQKRLLEDIPLVH